MSNFETVELLKMQILPHDEDLTYMLFEAFYGTSRIVFQLSLLFIQDLIFSTKLGQSAKCAKKSISCASHSSLVGTLLLGFMKPMISFTVISRLLLTRQLFAASLMKFPNSLGMVFISLKGIAQA